MGTRGKTGECICGCYTLRGQIQFCPLHSSAMRMRGMLEMFRRYFADQMKEANRPETDSPFVQQIDEILLSAKR